MSSKKLFNIELIKFQELSSRIIIKDVLLIVAGVLCAGLGLKGFLIPNHFLDGGITGISLLANIITGGGVSIFIIVFNIPFILLGIRQVSFWFALKTALAITALAICLEVIPYPVVTSDTLLISVFGGILLGAGIGFAIRGGCVIDGTEIAAIWVSRKTSISIGDIILIFNIVIFSAAAVITNLEIAMYAVLTYFSASRTIDFVIQGIEEYTGVTIITDFPEEVSEVITQKLGRGVTIYKGKKGYGKRGYQSNDSDIIFSVLTRLEVPSLMNEISTIDPDAFIIRQTINDTKGGMVKKRRLH